MNYEVGTVVIAKYTNFEGKRVTGLFLIIYSENNDIMTPNKKNYTALKVTSQLLDSSYVSKLNCNVVEFLDKDCYVACSKVHTLSYSEIIKSLGKLDAYKIMCVYRTYKRYQNELERQMLDII